MTVTRCRLPALLRAQSIPLTAEAFRELIESHPKTCPHDDCSPGAACQEQVREVATAAWVQRRMR